MIRFILKRKHRDNISGAEWTEMETFESHFSPLQAALQRGGMGQDGYDLTELVGVEIVGAVDSTAKPK